MAGFFDAIRLFLPGIFAEAHHWRERALNAEARLSELISQLDATFQRERAEDRAEREQFLNRLGSGLPLPLPSPDDGRDGGLRPPIPHANPIARAYEAAKEKEQRLQDDEIAEIVNEYLKANAITDPNSIVYDDRK